jgi:hypothetical protein
MNLMNFPLHFPVPAARRWPPTAAGARLPSRHGQRVRGPSGFWSQRRR